MEPHVDAAPQVKRGAALWSGRFLLLAVFLAGVGTLGIEMVASRLLAPFFGTSQPIWAVVIGMTLIYLAVGYQLGGRLADRSPHARTFYRVLCWAGFVTGFIPLLARPILGFAQQALAAISVGGFVGALFGVLALFALPVTLLAMVTPIAVRLQVDRARDTARVGSTTGTISAVSTVGSIVGAFLTVLVLIPAIGTARTTYLFAVLLIVIGVLGLRDWRYLALLAVVVALALYGFLTPGTIKSADCRDCVLLHEEESPYNYIQVARRETPNGTTINLLLNEGQAIHSVYTVRNGDPADARDLLTGGPWDYFAVGPYFYPQRDPSTVRRVAVLGSAAGTTPKQILAIYGPNTTVDAVEIDPRITELGREYFALDDASTGTKHPNYHVYTADARYWLATQAQGEYDIIGLDAYHQPYIPFHLTTVEFFRQVQQHLAADGVVVVNAGKGPSGDDRLGQALATTMRQVFPAVFVIETASGANQILVGVNQQVGDGVTHFVNNFAAIQSPALWTLMDWALTRGKSPVREFLPRAGSQVFTDDHAPIEQLIDSLIVDETSRLRNH